MVVLTTSITISAALAIIVGVLIIAFPKFIRWLLGLYLIIAGVLALI